MVKDLSAMQETWVGATGINIYVKKFLGNINTLLGNPPILLGWCNIVVVSDCEF